MKSMVRLIAVVSLLFAVPWAGAEEIAGLPLHVSKIDDGVIRLWLGDHISSTAIVAFATEKGIVVVDTFGVPEIDAGTAPGHRPRARPLRLRVPHQHPRARRPHRRQLGLRRLHHRRSRAHRGRDGRGRRPPRPHARLVHRSHRRDRRPSSRPSPETTPRRRARGGPHPQPRSTSR